MVLVAVSLLFIGSPSSLESKNVRSVVKAYVDSAGARHIVFSDGKHVKVKKEKGEVDSTALEPTSPVIADDRQTLGWLVYYKNLYTSYPIPKMLMVYRTARPPLRLGGGEMVGDWQFVARGKQVAFYTNTVHGDLEPHYELHDVRTGRLIEELDGPLDEKSPGWTDGLR